METSHLHPVEIDTAIAKLYDEIAKRFSRIDAEKFTLNNRYALSADRDRAEAAIARLDGEIAALWTDVRPYEVEYTRRGGWSRYYLVRNANGHVHTSTHCTTCFATTDYGWLVEFSGATEAEIVAEVGERACTVCMPTAPTHPQFSDGTSRMTVAERDAKRAAADEKAAKRAAKAAKLAADRFDTPVVLDKYTKISGLREAGMRLTDALWGINAYGAHIDSADDTYYRNAVERYTYEAGVLVAAIAAKTGRTPEDITAEWSKKAAKRK